ncbi:MAG: NAD(P)/FAD-dependent oxidoreductase [Betaproteobacteria bacterium]|nr:NAD(P)/FAD-dependent oxidoreductase [Betaproteobacteria bacterium]
MPLALKASPIETDCLVIGAGPAALFLVFELGLLEIGCHVVDVLPFAGGQCMALYADKPIYDIPGTVRSTGRELVKHLLTQASPFQTPFHLGQQITSIERQDDNRWLAKSSSGSVFLCKALVIAAGVGAFLPRKLAHLDLTALEGKQVFYEPTDTASQKHIVISGGGEEAVQAALSALAQQPASLTLVHRRDKLDLCAQTMDAYHLAVQTGQILFKPGQIQNVSDHQLELLDPSGQTQTMALGELWILQGLTPQLGPVAHWGLDMQKKQIKVNTENFATDVPGLFAIGDINTYPGKRKLIVSGFHEATLAAYGIAELVYPGQKIALEYTTASPRLHKLLGVTDATNS